MEEKTFRPFDCGSQGIDWEDANCTTCKKGDFNGGECEILDALTGAYLGDGSVSEEIAKRMGIPDDACVYCWPYPEHEEAQ